jgi:hypothetical protein
VLATIAGSTAQMLFYLRSSDQQERESPHIQHRIPRRCVCPPDASDLRTWILVFASRGHQRVTIHGPVPGPTSVCRASRHQDIAATTFGRSMPRERNLRAAATALSNERRCPRLPLIAQAAHCSLPANECRRAVGMRKRVRSSSISATNAMTFKLFRGSESVSSRESRCTPR